MVFTRLKRLRTLGDIMTSDDMVKLLNGITSDIRENVSDPSPAVEATLRTQVFVSKAGAVDRAVGQVGMAPWLKGVEAKRGPIARAVQRARS